MERRRLIGKYPRRTSTFTAGLSSHWLMLGQITRQQEVEEHIHFCTARKTFMSSERERNRNILVFKMCFWSLKPKLEQHGASHVAVYER